MHQAHAAPDLHSKFSHCSSICSEKSSMACFLVQCI